MLEKLKNFLGDKRFDIKECLDKVVEVRTIYNYGIDQEVYFSLEKKGNRQFSISRISRGVSHEIISFKDENLSFFYLGALGKRTISHDIKPIPEVLKNIDEIADENSGKAKTIVAEHIDTNYYSIDNLKREAICLLKKHNFYVVYFVDCTGKEKIISDDNDEFGMGLGVLCNYAWDYMWLEELTNAWDSSINKKSIEYTKLQDHFLNAKSS